MMVSYKNLLKVRLVNQPCPVCKKKPEVKDTKEVSMYGRMVIICKYHHVDEDPQPEG